jgi:hypothetical protein
LYELAVDSVASYQTALAQAENASRVASTSSHYAPAQDYAHPQASSMMLLADNYHNMGHRNMVPAHAHAPSNLQAGHNQSSLSFGDRGLLAPGHDPTVWHSAPHYRHQSPSLSTSLQHSRALVHSLTHDMAREASSAAFSVPQNAPHVANMQINPNSVHSSRESGTHPSGRHFVPGDSMPGVNANASRASTVAIAHSDQQDSFLDPEESIMTESLDDLSRDSDVSMEGQRPHAPAESKSHQTNQQNLDETEDPGPTMHQDRHQPQGHEQEKELQRESHCQVQEHAMHDPGNEEPRMQDLNPHRERELDISKQKQMLERQQQIHQELQRQKEVQQELHRQRQADRQLQTQKQLQQQLEEQELVEQEVRREQEREEELLMQLKREKELERLQQMQAELQGRTEKHAVQDKREQPDVMAEQLEQETVVPKQQKPQQKAAEQEQGRSLHISQDMPRQPEVEAMQPKVSEAHARRQNMPTKSKVCIIISTSLCDSIT